jgi:hypothetical protein
MPINERQISMKSTIDDLLGELQPYGAQLVAVSKTKPASLIREAYDAGQLDFGENYVQELETKQSELPAELRWHFIGHLQSNKVKLICPFVHLIHGADNLKLIQIISKYAIAAHRTIDILLQVHIATEETKFGFSETELLPVVSALAEKPLEGIRIRGLMGMASFTSDQNLVSNEFRGLKKLFDETGSNISGAGNFKWDTLSMGMSADYKIALKEGSTLVRIGSAIFGTRQN